MKTSIKSAVFGVVVTVAGLAAWEAVAKPWLQRKGYI